jgi:hypothetical protein
MSEHALFIRISYDFHIKTKRITLATYFHTIQVIDNFDRNILVNLRGTAVKRQSSLKKYKTGSLLKKKSENWPKFIRLVARKVQMLLDYCPRLCYKLHA